MKMQTKELMLGAGIATIGIAIGGYIYLNYTHNGIKDMNKLEAQNKWDLQGYLNGLCRGSGDTNKAQENLTAWRTWAYQVAPDMGSTIEEWYQYGQMRISIMYGA